MYNEAAFFTKVEAKETLFCKNAGLLVKFNSKVNRFQFTLDS